MPNLHDTIIPDYPPNPELGEWLHEKVKPKRILFADDDPTPREIFTEAAKNFNCELTVVEDGREVLKLLKRDNFDNVLLDIKMPGIDGTEVFRIMRENDHLLPVVFLSAYLDLSTMDKIHKIGFALMVIKPMIFDLHFVTQLMQSIGCRPIQLMPS
jgi:CheY-like chemotaxis protein